MAAMETFPRGDREQHVPRIAGVLTLACRHLHCAALYWMQVYSKSGNPSLDRRWVDRTLTTLHPLLGFDGEFYNHFHCVKDPWRTYFGPQAARLQEIKKMFDPNNRLGGLQCQQGVVLQ